MSRALYPLEQRAQGEGVNWVMLNTDDPRWAPVWQYYGVDELPHFEFLDGAHAEMARGYGLLDPAAVEREVAALRTAPAL